MIESESRVVASAVFSWPVLVKTTLTMTTVEDDVDAVWTARGDFWAKARGGDLAGAKARLAPLVAANPDLWAYEAGYLAAQAK